MLIKIEELQSYSLDSLDGEIGKVKEFYFDDRYWSIRYLVADTGHWLMERQVLISPYALVAVDKDTQNIIINLNRQQIENSPSLNSDMPVSRQFEAKYFEYYQWPKYWVGTHMWGVNPDIRRSDEKNQSELTVAEEWNANLRSTSAVSGYYIHAQDGEIGHVDDFIIDDETWSIRYLVINTSNWWLGKKVLIAPSWIESVNWDTSEVYVNMSREVIKHAPEYTDWSILTREFEDCLHKHYEREKYRASRNDA
ncbi:MAG: PRC-barrel domain-containing protein [Kiritimatiellia bacterium]